MQVREIEFSSTILIISKRSKQWRIIQERFNAINCQQGVPCSCSVSKISVEQLGSCIMAIRGNAIQCLRLSCSSSFYGFARFQCSTISLLIFDNIKIVLLGDLSSLWFLVGFLSIWGNPCCHLARQVKLTIELGSSCAQVREMLNQRNECSGGFFATTVRKCASMEK